MPWFCLQVVRVSGQRGMTFICVLRGPVRPRLSSLLSYSTLTLLSGLRSSPDETHWRRGPALLCLRGLCSARAPPSAHQPVKVTAVHFLPSESISEAWAEVKPHRVLFLPVPECLLPCTPFWESRQDCVRSWLGSNLDLGLGFSTDLLFDSGKIPILSITSW